MLTLTSKQLVVEWETNWFADPKFEAANTERATKLAEMEAAGKIVSPPFFVSPTDRDPDTSTASTIIISNWVDQASADAYSQFITALAEQYALPLLSTRIRDVTPEEIATYNQPVAPTPAV